MDARQNWQKAYVAKQIRVTAPYPQVKPPQSQLRLDLSEEDCGSEAGGHQCTRTLDIAPGSGFQRSRRFGLITRARSAQPKKKMGVSFRNSSSLANVFIGRRTVKDGEAMGLWDISGQYKVIEGPERRWIFASRLVFLDRHIADSTQYLVIQYRSGKKEHKRGPISMFEDPVLHESVEVMNAVTVDAFEVVVVYSEDSSGSVKRSLIPGPKVFVPEVSQWLHVFKWHGSKSSTDLYDKVPGALVFTKLRTIADQFYYNCEGVRTADDASLTIKVMIFFEMVSVEDMLNTTHDPIGDFINGLLADMMNFCSCHSYEAFIQQAQQLSELTTYPMLVSRANSIGFKINKVVYRGYSANAQLQSLCDQAIKTRTELRLNAEQEEQKQKLRDMELTGTTSRGIRERQEEEAKQVHKLRLQAETHKEGMRQKELEHEKAMQHQLEEQQARLEAKMGDNRAQLEYLKGLKDMGVDLTKYMVALAEKSPDRVLKVTNGEGSLPFNLHANL